MAACLGTRSDEFGTLDPIIVPADLSAGIARPVGIQSATTAISKPGVVGICDRNIDPNLPAPIRARGQAFQLLHVP